MGTFRIVNTDLWVDPLVQKDFTPEDKLFWVYLITNPLTTQLGIYQITSKQMAFDLGFSEDTTKNLLLRFEEYHERIIYDYQKDEIAILNYLRWNIIKGGKPVEDCLKADLNKVRNKDLIIRIYNHLLCHMDMKAKPFNSKIIEILDNYIKNLDNKNEDDNDNDNERIVPRIVPRIVTSDDIFKKYAGDNYELHQSLIDFEMMRKSMKKPMTDRAKEMLCKELDRMQSQGENIIECLNQSIFHSWQGIFPMKRGDKFGTNKKSSEPAKPKYEINSTKL